MRKKTLLTLLEAAFAVMIPVGVGMIWVPAGMIVAGFLGVLALERSVR